MASGYPTSLDAFLAYVDGTTIMEALNLNNMEDAIEKLQVKVGIDNSIVTSSHDYKLSNLPGDIQVVNSQTGVVATGTALIPLDDTIPQSNEGTQFMTRSITPSSATSKLKIDVVLNLSHTSGGQKMTVSLFKDSDANALAAISDSLDDGSGDPLVIKFTHYMTAGSPSSITFKVRAGCQAAGTTTFNGSGGSRKMGGVMASSITITEIRA